MGLLTADADAFSQCLASKTGLNVNVVRAWVILESAGGRSPAGPYNFLNMRSGSGWARYASAADACDAAYHNLISGPVDYGYRVILDSSKAPPPQQIFAIGVSKWCYSSSAPGHLCYGGWGAPNLVNIYNQLTTPKIQPANFIDPSYVPVQDRPSHPVQKPDTTKQSIWGTLKEGLLGASPVGGAAALTQAGVIKNPLDAILKYGLRAVYVILGIVAAGIGVVFIAKETEAGKQIIQKVPVAAKVASYA